MAKVLTTVKPFFFFSHVNASFLVALDIGRLGASTPIYMNMSENDSI